MNSNTDDLYPRSPKPDQVYDVIVAGGGPAAIGAALAAAINGATTLVLEARSQFGGTATAAMWMEINFLFKDNDETDRDGVHTILVDAIRQWGPDASIPGRRSVSLPGSGGNLDVHPEYLKKVIFDLSKSETLTLMEKMAIDQAIEFIRFAREKKLPGMEDVYLMRTGGYAMARDTRRLVGEYRFDHKDVMEGTQFEDAIASKYGGSDPVGEQRPYTAIKQGALFPYRSLLPRNMEGLLVAGRCSSATMLGHYGGKSMGNMISVGQGAGVAAALCAQLDYRLIQAKLDEMGVSL